MANTDDFTFIPVEDAVDHPVCKALRWDVKAIKRKIREGLLVGKINTRGDASITMAEVFKASFMYQLDLAIDQGVLKAALSGEPSTDYANMALEALINDMFGIEGLSMKKLKEAVLAARR